MKLKGTWTEQTYREQLIASKTRLFNDRDMRRFLSVIRETFPEMKTAYILYWIPEQGEDIITFLIDTHSIIDIELDRYDERIAPIMSVIPIENWSKGLSKTNQIKLAVAMELAKKDLESK
ncbi:hypothetical protein H8B09_06245 [Paenibacillus sp. PR3]|uniref:Uncharacterized protein n=1 Tax=Paenibacillus terricola TaxID=2763503 RepID=A0ABR8MW22_9BACL|nr:hypothetical protein [Paenibacillus terricola]MBD3918349.1 hypothetical protein [Paenibacillus terricola]